MSLKQILLSTCLLATSMIATADSGLSLDSRGGSYSNSGGGNGYGQNYGSGSGDGGGGGGQNNQNNQGGQSSSDSGGWGSWNTASADQNQNLQTVTAIETMMMTTTLTELVSACATDAVATATSSTSWGSGGSWGSATPGSVQVVTVSDETGSLTYSPESVVAEVGSIVEFHFYPKNHTVTQSSFAAPCVPIEVSTPNITTPGIKSGFVPVASNATDFIKGIRSSFSITINDTNPIWIYCGQTSHCQKGMAMVINQNMTDTVKTLANYKAAAALVPLPANNTAPGGVNPYAPQVASQSTSTSTFTAPPVVATAAPTTTASAPAILSATPTAPSASIAPFTGAAVQGVVVRKMSAVAVGVLAVGVVAVL